MIIEAVGSLFVRQPTRYSFRLRKGPVMSEQRRIDSVHGSSPAEEYMSKLLSAPCRPDISGQTQSTSRRLADPVMTYSGVLQSPKQVAIFPLVGGIDGENCLVLGPIL